RSPRHVPRVGRARKSPDGILVPFSSPPQTTSGSLIRKVSGVWVHGRAGWSAPPYAGRSRNLAAARRRAGRGAGAIGRCLELLSRAPAGLGSRGSRRGQAASLGA